MGACANGDGLAGRATLIVLLDPEDVAAGSKGRLCVDNAQHASPHVVHSRAGVVGALKGGRDAFAARDRVQRGEEKE